MDIITASTNAACFILYENYNKFTLDNFIVEDGKVLYRFERNEKNLQAYNTYKETCSVQGKLMVDIIKFNKIYNFLKNKTKEYKNSLTNGQKVANAMREMQNIFSKGN